MASCRNKRGRYKKCVKREQRVYVEHNYCVEKVCNKDCNNVDCSECDTDSTWKEGRRIIELFVLLQILRSCQKCRLGPVPITIHSVKGETKKGLSGYFHVQCQNLDCGFINTVAYGKTNFVCNTGAPCFVVNTKVGTAMIDSYGGPTRLKNVLAALNIPSISNRNLKKMERRAGRFVEKVAIESAHAAAKTTLEQELKDVGDKESLDAEAGMEIVYPDLGIGILPESSPSVKVLVQSCTGEDLCWEDKDNTVQDVQTPTCKPRRKRFRRLEFQKSKAKRTLAPKFPCKTRSGIPCAVDTAWQKRGFDSLTSHTYFMSKAKYGKKVIKSIISHRICTCSWWRRNRPGQPVRKHIKAVPDQWRHSVGKLVSDNLLRRKSLLILLKVMETAP